MVVVSLCFFSSRRRHTRCSRDWSSDVCSSDLNANALRPFLGYSTITLYDTTGRSKYNALQTQLERRSSRFGFSVSYTYSRTTDNGAGRNDLLPNAFDDSGNYGISDLDRPHVLVSQAHYRFP